MHTRVFPHSDRSSTRLRDAQANAFERGTAIAWALGLVALWTLTHRYRGLEGDAELYAVQALARMHPNLARDLFLRSTSQDSYTIFSAVYARCIAWIGFRPAALVLTLVCKLWFFSASWSVARTLSTRGVAFLAVALLIVLPGEYGAYRVFHYAEDWLTARSLGEALVASTLALALHRRRMSAAFAACTALLVHPLMALPGIALLLCLWAPLRMAIAGALAAILVSLGLALVAARGSVTGVLALMDPTWLEVVRERSQFLFLQIWSPTDWAKCARAFLSVVLAGLVVPDPRARRLCTSVLIVGATGLVIALLASLVPVTLLLQGQAWRWVWLSSYVGILLLAPASVALWRTDRWGPLCIILMLGAWVLGAAEGCLCLAGAVTIVLIKPRMMEQTAPIVRGLTIAAGVAVATGALARSWNTVASTGIYPSDAITRVKALASVEIVSLLAAALFAYVMSIARSRARLTLVAAGFIMVSSCALPGAFRTRQVDGAPSLIAEFSNWRSAIPPDSNVLVVPAHNSASFAWFTLERPSYLSVDQSSGVVFSRATALEVVRRSRVLLPLMDPDWRLLSDMRKAHAQPGHDAAHTRPLTRDRLVSVCSDAQLGFVVAKEDVGFSAVRHTGPGIFRDYLLYDCRHVRASARSALERASDG